MKAMLGLVAAPAILLFFIGCAATMNTANLRRTYQCRYMKDICRESEEFEREYRTMNVDRKKEAETFLHAYYYQCNEAMKACEKSQKDGTPELDTAENK